MIESKSYKKEDVSDYVQTKLSQTAADLILTKEQGLDYVTFHEKAFQ